MKAEAKGFAVTCSDPVHLDDRPTSVDMVLSSGATVEGRVVDPLGMPVSGAQVKTSTFLSMGTLRNSLNLPSRRYHPRSRPSQA